MPDIPLLTTPLFLILLHCFGGEIPKESDNKMTNTIAIGYGRVSFEETSEEKISLTVQRKNFETMCQKHGWINGGWYQDRGLSSASYWTGCPLIPLDTATSDYLSTKPPAQRTRKGLADAFQMCQKSKASILWTNEETRLMRPVANSMLSAAMFTNLKSLSLSLWTNEGVVDTDRLESRIVGAIKTITADADRQQRRAQSMSGRDLLKDAGKLANRPTCLGYRSEYKGVAKPIPEELDTVKRIFAQYIQGATIRKIVVSLSDNFIKPPHGGRVWNRRTVTGILSRPWYAGYQYASDKSTLIRCTSFLETIKLSDWHAVQSRLSKNESTGHKRDNKIGHCLVGLIRCGYCHRMMIPVVARRKPGTKPAYYYRCGNNDTNRAQISSDCKSATMRECIHIPALIDQQHGYLRDSEGTVAMAGLVEALYPLTIAGYIRQLKEKDTTPELISKRDSIKSQIQTLTDKLTSRYQDYEDGLITRDVYANLSNLSKKQQAELSSQLEGVNKSISNATKSIQVNLSHLDQLDKMSHREYCSLIRKVVNCVYCFADRIEIETVLNETISIPRIHIANGKQLPIPVVTYTKDGGEYAYAKGITKQVKPASTTLFDAVIIDYHIPNLPKPKTVYRYHDFLIRLLPAK